MNDVHKYLRPSSRVDKNKWDNKDRERQYQYGEQSQGSMSTLEASDIAIDVPALQAGEVGDKIMQRYMYWVLTYVFTTK